MNIAEYIESGVIEAYVSGIASEAEVRELEQLMLQYPELKEAVLECQAVMGAYAASYRKEPPASLKENIRAKLIAEDLLTTAAVNIRAEAPARRSIPIWALAASLVLLVGSVVTNLVLLSNQQQLKTEMNQVAALQKATLQEKQLALAKSESMQQAMHVLELPKLKKINLAGVAGHEAHSGMLYWDGATGDVFLDLASMPAAPEGKQYRALGYCRRETRGRRRV
ncbi:MAG: anti-sigma factor [Chitinophagaceae bacterium]